MDMSEDLHHRCQVPLSKRVRHQACEDESDEESEAGHSADEGRAPQIPKRFDANFGKHLFKLIESRDPELAAQWADVSARMEEAVVAVMHECGMLNDLAAGVVAINKELSNVPKMKRRRYATEEERQAAKIRRIQRYNDKRRLMRKFKKAERQKQLSMKSCETMKSPSTTSS
uniref:CCT domain-containing protein n=1 Tax=Steinernema glaseri TaxID=37863 RepID=A0A1I7Z6N9_9BILA